MYIIFFTNQEKGWWCFTRLRTPLAGASNRQHFTVNPSCPRNVPDLECTANLSG